MCLTAYLTDMGSIFFVSKNRGNKKAEYTYQKPEGIARQKDTIREEDVEEALKMKEASERNNKVLMIMRNNRYYGHSVFAKKYIESGKMGDIYCGRCGWIRRRGIPGKGGWFTTKAQSGGGPLID